MLKSIRVLLLFCFIIGSQLLSAQTARLQGYVIDKLNKDTLSFVSILNGADLLGNADEFGLFDLLIDTTAVRQLVFSQIGYKPYTLHLTAREFGSAITIILESNTTQIDGVTVNAKKTKYKNKDNPAVDLMRKVIDAKSSNQQINNGYLQYDQYDKISLSINNVPKIISKNPLLKKQAFVFENVDSVSYEGQKLVPVYIEEKLTKHFQRTQPLIDKVYLVGHKAVQLNERFINNNMINDYLTHIYKKVDIYDNDIMIMTNQFLSPIAAAAPTFYKYFLGDTVIVDKDTIIEIGFGPRNKTDFLFNGFLKIRLHDFAVQHANLSISKDINLNFVKNFKIDIVYTQDTFQKYYPQHSNLHMEFGFKEWKHSVFGVRNLIFTNNIPGLHQPDSVYANPFVVDSILYRVKNDTVLQYLRPDSLTPYELQAYKNMDSLKHQKSFNNLLKYSRLLFLGYFRTKYFEIGPTNAFYAFNPVEGFRLRFGGRTAIDATRNFMLESYAAYGFKDEKWKYFGAFTFSLKPRSELIYNYPFNYFRVSYQNDTRLPGQSPGFVQEGNFFLSFKRGENDKYIYNKIFKIEYVREFSNHIRFHTSFQNMLQVPAGSWYYISSGDNDTLTSLRTTVLGFNIRWAPNEKIIQSRTSRTVMPNKYPIITTNVDWSLKDIGGGMHNYQKYSAEIAKRFYFSQLGFMNVTLGGVYYNGQNIPFPILDIAAGNQTYNYSVRAYNMMNYMEFISDKNAYFHAEYFMGGFILNKIPVIKYLRFREVFGLKAIYGDLNPTNNPTTSTQIFKFPMDEDGNYTTNAFDKNIPYVEASAGITNLFRVIRVDVVWRLTYLNKPNVSPVGLRVGVHFDF